MVEVNCRDGGTPSNTSGAPEVNGAKGENTRGHQVLIVLATNVVLNVTCHDASRIISSGDGNLPEGLRAKTASHCLADLKRIFSSGLWF